MRILACVTFPLETQASFLQLFWLQIFDWVGWSSDNLRDYRGSCTVLKKKYFEHEIFQAFFRPKSVDAKLEIL